MHRGIAAPSNEQMLSSLLESQNKVVLSKRLGALENVVAGLNTKANDSVSTTSCSSSPDEKKRLPPQLSVSCTSGCIIMCVHIFNLFFRKLLQRYTMHLMMTNNSNHTWGMYMYVHVAAVACHYVE